MKFILFFDEASKGNPKAARARGFVLDHNGKQEASFKERLGKVINNHVDALSLYKGLKVIDPWQIKNLIAIRDSTIIIRPMRNSSIHPMAS